MFGYGIKPDTFRLDAMYMRLKYPIHLIEVNELLKLNLPTNPTKMERTVKLS